MSQQAGVTAYPSHTIELHRSPDGTLDAEIAGQHYKRVTLRRSFAFSMPDSFISLDSYTGEKLALLLNMNAFSDECRNLAYQELNRAHRITRIIQLESIEKAEAEWVWKVQTDEGPARIGMKRLEDNIHAITSSRQIITDDDGRRFELSSIQRMNANSRYYWNTIQTLIEPERRAIFFE